MAKAGCKALHYGLESASPRVSELMKKGINLALTEEILRNTKNAGILTHVWVIFGFPGELEEDAQITKDFVLKLHAAGLLDSIEINAFSLTRFSPVGRHHCTVKILMKREMFSQEETERTREF